MCVCVCVCAYIYICIYVYYTYIYIYIYIYLGQREVVIAAHNACIQELLQEHFPVHGKADRHMRLLTIETESRLSTLWDQERCNQFCSKEELWRAARDEELKIPWQEANEGPPEHNGRAVSRKILAAKTRWNWIGYGNQRVPSHRIQTNAGCEEQLQLRGEGNTIAQEQYKSLLTGLQAVSQVKGWKVQQIVFVGGTC
jgi:hypothetical protein